MRTKRILSSVLTLTMLASMTTAFASTVKTIEVKVDSELSFRNALAQGKDTETNLFTIGEKKVENVSISSGDYFITLDNFSEYSDKLPNGTTYTIEEITNSNGLKVLSYTTDDIEDDIFIDITTAQAEYYIVANAGSYGTNNNYGSAGDASATVDYQNQTVSGGDTYSITFTPDDGQQIDYLNIRPYTSNETNLIDVSSKTVSVSGRQYTIDEKSDGSVTLSSKSATNDLFVTALTTTKKDTYSLSVSTGDNLSSDVSSKTVNEGTSSTIKLTPTLGYNVDSIKITDGSSTGTIGLSATSVTVNGNKYSVSRDIDGVATLSVPSATANVSISATANNDYHTVTVVDGYYTTSSQDGTNYIKDGEGLSVTFAQKTTSEISGVTITTSTGIYYADVYSSYIYINGVYSRMSYNSSTGLTVYLSNIYENMTITVDAYSNSHIMYLYNDGHASFDQTSGSAIKTSSTQYITISPDDYYTLDYLKITYNSTSYIVDISNGDTYVYMGSTWHPITYYSDGSIMITIYNVTSNLTVRAYTDSDYAGTFYLTRTSGSNTSISFTGTSPFIYGESTTITVTPSNSYSLNNVTLTTDSDTVTVKNGDKYFTLDGTLHYAYWASNGVCTIDLPTLTKDLHVTSSATYGTPIDGDYHAAYLQGYGSSLFGPDNNMTRAEAILTLCRLYYPSFDNDSYSAYFYDAPSGSWYFDAVAFAREEGFLDFMTGGGRYLYPDSDITRAELIYLLCEFEGIEVTYDSSNYFFNTSYIRFTDVVSTHWASNAINYAANMNWVQGVGDGTFQPDRTITRAEVASMINGVLGRQASPYNTFSMSFADVTTSHWAYLDIMEATIDHIVGSYTQYGEIWASQGAGLTYN